ESERALVSLYGMLAQGFTRNTFVCGEGLSLRPSDPGGRIFYCPPNSAANAHFLSMLRYALLQDWDIDDDGRPETLRLLFATPRRWLEDGKEIKVERAPTAFGSVSVHMQSLLSKGKVMAELELPTRNEAKHSFLRARVRGGWRMTGATGEQQRLQVDRDGTVDITGWKGKVAVQFTITKK